MSYRINVARSVGPNWNNSGPSYQHYFAIVTDTLLPTVSMTPTGKTLEMLVCEMRDQYPLPHYDVTVTKSSSTSTELDM